MNKLHVLTLLAVTAVLGGCCTQHKAKTFEYSWERVTIDDTYDNTEDLRATEAIAKYAPMMEAIQEIIGYSSAEYTSNRPESELSDLAADAVLHGASKAFGTTMDLGLTNFGGIRTNLPKGAVRVYDLYSIFPFYNYLVWARVKGDRLQEFFQKMAKRRPEALSGVELVINDKKVEKLLVGGKPIDPDRIYNLATIDFLLEGGDDLKIQQYSIDVQKSEVLIRDAVIDEIRSISNDGGKFTLHKDGRVIVKGEDRR